MSAKNDRPPTKMDRVEEAVIAIILGSMTLMTFANVVARYVFNSNIFYALELTVFLFAWLVLLGTAYAVKKNLQLGVDAIVNLLPHPHKRRISLFCVFICLIYTCLLLKGAWDYWAPFANLPPTTGRWFPTGFVEKFRGQGWYETQDIPVPFFLTWLEGVFNDGDPYEKLPKVVPYLVLPLSMVFLLVRYIQVAGRVYRREQDMIIVSHEAEESIAEANQSVTGQN